jgi:probable rRNA maturation factor
MSITFVTEDIAKPRLNYRKVTHWIRLVLSKYSLSPDGLTFIFCDDNYLLEINKKFLNHNYFTDIITFDYSEDNVVSGDLFISIERVQENSMKFKSFFLDEILRVIIHGVLHLVGFNDKSAEEKIIMRKLEEESLQIYREM